MRYQIEIKRTSYIDFIIDAEDEEAAFKEALEMAEIEGHDKEFWELSYCEKVEE